MFTSMLLPITSIHLPSLSLLYSESKTLSLPSRAEPSNHTLFLVSQMASFFELCLNRNSSHMIPVLRVGKGQLVRRLDSLNWKDEHSNCILSSLLHTIPYNLLSSAVSCHDQKNMSNVIVPSAPNRAWAFGNKPDSQLHIINNMG